MPFLSSTASGLSYCTRRTVESVKQARVNVEYASFLSRHMGSVLATVSMHSSMGRRFSIIVESMFAVSVESMFALTPLPSPSLSTATSCSPFFFIEYESPHSVSSCLFMLAWPLSMNRSTIYCSSFSIITASFSLDMATFVSAADSPRRDAIS